MPVYEESFINSDSYRSNVNVDREDLARVHLCQGFHAPNYAHSYKGLVSASSQVELI